MKDNHKPNHKCLACGIEYYACDSCDRKIDKTWRTACCTEGHYKAYYAMWQYGQGLITREEVANVLTEQDALSWKDAPGRDMIREILDVPAEEEQAEKPADAPAPDAVPAEKVPEESDEKDEPKPADFREKRKKKTGN